MQIRDKKFEIDKHTYICAILNVTPDSFSDGGEAYGLVNATDKARTLISSGADLLDIGGESTRPGFTEVSVSEEIRRVVPVIEQIRKFSQIPISVDTRKSEVAEAALAAGADLVNDVSGLCFDPAMAEVIARNNAYCCLMHDGSYFEKQPEYIDGVIKDLEKIASHALDAGIDKSRIILDPGVGFGKDAGQNLLCIRELKRFVDIGYPVLLGCSRKSVIGAVTGLTVNERLEGTLATTAMAVMAGVGFVRVHDVRENLRFVSMMEALCR
ncbi:MAG: dihydropteroate synthase [Lachnospiraceae bacterium]|jgi:dihydropteroate synthase|nr:dihydropteroate synthase [Lachnospiraceae bacterium]